MAIDHSEKKRNPKPNIYQKLPGKRAPEQEKMYTRGIQNEEVKQLRPKAGFLILAKTTCFFFCLIILVIVRMLTRKQADGIFKS